MNVNKNSGKFWFSAVLVYIKIVRLLEICLAFRNKLGWL
jgi:hypothetical protein